jgi:hypothetical protein
MLRYRDGAVDREFTAPTTIIGEVTGADVDVVTITSHGRSTTLYLSDLQAAFEGSSSLTLGVMLDAYEHHDRVRVGLTRDRVTYDNEAQLARFKAKASAGGSGG